MSYSYCISLWFRESQAVDSVFSKIETFLEEHGIREIENVTYEDTPEGEEKQWDKSVPLAECFLKLKAWPYLGGCSFRYPQISASIFLDFEGGRIAKGEVDYLALEIHYKSVEGDEDSTRLLRFGKELFESYEELGFLFGQIDNYHFVQEKYSSYLDALAVVCDLIPKKFEDEARNPNAYSKYRGLTILTRSPEAYIDVAGQG